MSYVTLVVVTMILTTFSMSSQTNVPDIRLAYRHQTLLGELDMIRGKGVNS